MHLQAFYKRRSWQIFLIGLTLGALVSYVFFLYLYGEMYEQMHIRHATLSTELQDVKRQNEALQSDQNKEKAADFVIESITIRFAPTNKLQLNRLQLLTLENMMKEELKPMIGKSVQSIIDQEAFIIATLENKRFSIDEKTYYCETYTLVITNEVVWTVKLFEAK